MISWKDLWHMEAKRLSFIRTTYNILPTLSSLHQWLGKDSGCACCTRASRTQSVLKSLATTMENN